jgi:cardiolipin synthase (CMP-forming)
VEGAALSPPAPGDRARPFAAGQTPRERAEAARERAQDGAERARLTFRRLSGLDRSGPPPPETLRGQPLHVWTIPNAIGFVRLGLIPIFLRSAWRVEGQGRRPATYFAVIAWSDYADGIAARITGQYSRFGTLLDPLVDRLLTISGVAVCWRFRLLPRTGLAVLMGREASMLWLARWALRQPGELDSTVNWYGRAGVWPVMSAPFFAMIGRRRVAQGCLATGVPLMLMATVEYLRDMRRQLRARTSS